MENSTLKSNPSPWPIAIKFGIMGGVAIIFINLIQYLMGMMDIDKIMENAGSFSLSNVLSGLGIAFLSYIVFTLIYWLAVKAYRDELGGFITFGEGFKVSFFSVLVKALIALVWGLVFHYLINPGFSEGMLEMMGEVMQQSSGGDEEAMEMVMNIYSYMYNPFSMSLMGAFSTLTGGALLSLVAAAIGQKERPTG